MTDESKGYASGYLKRDEEVRRYLHMALQRLLPRLVETVLLTIDKNVQDDRQRENTLLDQKDVRIAGLEREVRALVQERNAWREKAEIVTLRSNFKQQSS